MPNSLLAVPKCGTTEAQMDWAKLRPCFENHLSCSSRRQEAQNFCEFCNRSEPPHVGCYNFKTHAFLANLAVNLIVNFIDFRPFSMKFSINSTKTSSQTGAARQNSFDGHCPAGLVSGIHEAAPIDLARVGADDPGEDDVVGR